MTKELKLLMTRVAKGEISHSDALTLNKTNKGENQRAKTPKINTHKRKSQLNNTGGK